MDVIAILLALLSGAGNGVGLLVDQTAEQILRDQLDQADVLEVRVQSLPNYQLIQGRADRILVAGRGLARVPFPRIDVLELETDPIFLNPSALRGGPLEFDQPLQAAIRVVIREADLNTALQAAEVLEQFQDIEAELPFSSRPGSDSNVFDLRNPAADFLPDNRVQLSAQLVEKTEAGDELDALDIDFRARLEVEAGQTLRLESPEFLLGSVPVPREIANAFLGGLNDVFDLSELDEQGFVIRVLNFEVDDDTLEVIGFVRVESFEALTNPNKPRNPS